jgi:glycolate oxidase FAD binding subunit
MVMEGLRSVISEEQMEEKNRLDTLLGNNGKVAVYPETERDIAGVLKYAHEHEKKVTIMGSGTKRGFGGVEPFADILISMKNYSGIIEHTVGDMTLSAKSGTTYKELQDYLARYKQKIPLDPFFPEQATIGGVIAANDSGPKRLGYGSARDMVIGLRIVYPDGTIIRTGGKTVKNVAGYDMNKLFIGSMGTLGVLSEVTIKLRPLPKCESLVLLSFPDGNLNQIHTFTVNLLDSVMEPTALELLSPTLAERLTGNPSYTLAICFEDVEQSVRYQVGFVKDLQPSHSKLSVLEQSDAQTFWNVLANITVKDNTLAETIASVKIGIKNLDVLKIIKESQLLQDSHNLIVEAHGGLGHGICQVHLVGASFDVISAITQLRSLAVNLGGYAIVSHLPLALRQQLEVWGEKPAHFFLLEGIKTKIDPKRILNHKRFVGGI